MVGPNQKEDNGLKNSKDIYLLKKQVFYKYYNEEAYEFLKKVKKLNDAHLSLNEIEHIFEEQGVPSSDNGVNRLISRKE